ncbi:MAG: hypothetical protein OEY51_08705, partial [Cyclobacteriaceae bacterium]|nr:hypothetical protein [Cyclobacteriaceae bacterium]
DYLYPQPLPGNKILAVKRGMSDIETFIVIDSLGKEKKLFVPGIVNGTGMISSNGLALVWNEFHFNPRWRAEDYSVIKILNLESGKSKTLTKKSRFNGAAISPSGKKIVTTTTTEEYKHALVLIDAEKPTEAITLPNPLNYFYSNVRFGSSENTILAVRTIDQRKDLVMINVENGAVEELILKTSENIAYPVQAEDFILYNSDISGVENIYAIHIPTKRIFQVTASKYGAFNAAFSRENRKIYYNDHQLKGMDIVAVRFLPESWKYVGEKPVKTPPLFEEIYQGEGKTEFLSTVQKDSFEIKKYNRLSGIFNPHSWGPFLSSSLTEAQAGIFSQDVLSTTAMYAGYSFDVFELTGQFNTSLSYQGLYPIFDVEYFMGNRQAERAVNSTETINFSWKEHGVNVSTRIPLLLTRSRFLRNLEIKNTSGVKEVYQFENSLGGTSRRGIDFFERDIQDNGELVYTTFRISGANALKKNYRDIKPRWGQFFNAEYTTTVNRQFEGEQLSVNTWMYFPGLFKHQSLWTYWAFQHKAIINDKDNYYFRNRIQYPRGNPRLTFENYYSMGVNYTMPLLYPDLRVGSLLYVQRVRADLFFDYGYGNTSLQNPFYFDQWEYMSTGLELRFDFNVMRFFPKVEMGVRYNYGFTAGHSFELIFPSIDL